MNYKCIIQRAPGRKSYTNNYIELAVEAQVLQVRDSMVLIISPALEAVASLISYIFSH